MDIMTLLGHTTLKMMHGYSHAVPQKLRTAIDSLAQGRVLPMMMAILTMNPSCAVSAIKTFSIIQELIAPILPWR
jgi:hypothetical protein